MQTVERGRVDTAPQHKRPEAAPPRLAPPAASALARALRAPDLLPGGGVDQRTPEERSRDARLALFPRLRSADVLISGSEGRCDALIPTPFGVLWWSAAAGTVFDSPPGLPDAAGGDGWVWCSRDRLLDVLAARAKLGDASDLSLSGLLSLAEGRRVEAAEAWLGTGDTPPAVRRAVALRRPQPPPETRRLFPPPAWRAALSPWDQGLADVCWTARAATPRSAHHQLWACAVTGDAHAASGQAARRAAAVTLGHEGAPLLVDGLACEMMRRLLKSGGPRRADWAGVVEFDDGSAGLARRVRHPKTVETMMVFTGRSADPDWWSERLPKLKAAMTPAGPPAVSATPDPAAVRDWRRLPNGIGCLRFTGGGLRMSTPGSRSMGVTCSVEAGASMTFSPSRQAVGDVEFLINPRRLAEGCRGVAAPRLSVYRGDSKTAATLTVTDGALPHRSGLLLAADPDLSPWT